MKPTRIDWIVKSGGAMRKCGIYGCKKTGATIAYALALRGLFSDLILCDSSPARAAAEAAALAEILPFLSPTDIYAGTAADMQECDMVVFSPAEGADAELALQRLAAALGASTDRQPILINAVQPMSEWTQRLHDTLRFDAGRIFGIGGIAEELRLCRIVGRHMGVSHTAVHIYLTGMDSELFPLWSHADIAGSDPLHFCEMQHRGFDVGVADGLFRSMQKKSKKCNTYAISEAVCLAAGAIVRDENRPLSLTCPMQGHYNLDGISICAPCILGRGGIKHILEISLTREEETALQRLQKEGAAPLK